MQLTTRVEEQIEAFLALLDRDIPHLQGVLTRLEQIREYILQRNEEALTRLLEVVRGEADLYGDQEARRRRSRETLAEVLHCRVEDVTLTRLEAYATPSQRPRLVERRETLKALAVQLKLEHLKTSRLLAECRRFNTALLNELLGLDRHSMVTYGAHGRMQRNQDNVLMNWQF